MASFFDFGKSFGQAYDAERQRVFQQEEASKTRDLQISENSKSREQARQLQREEIASTLKNLKLQLAQSAQQHAETLTQTATLTREGWAHDTNLQTKKIQAEVDMHNKTLAYNNAALRATQQYQYSTTYDQARETQLAFKKLGIDGDVKIDQYGYARFYPGEISITAEKDLASTPKPIPTEFPKDTPLEFLGNHTTPKLLYNITMDIMHKYYPQGEKDIANIFGERKRPEENIQKLDLNSAEAYAQKVRKVIDENPRALDDPRTVLAMDALNKILNRSEFSQQEVQTNVKYDASRDMQSYIQMLMTKTPKQ